MRIEIIAYTTNRWYFLLIPSICLFYDSKEKAAGAALMWLNGIIGMQIGKSNNK